MAKALVLISGGLDSMLAARILMEQGVEVVGVSFRSYFFDTVRARKAAEELGIKLIEVDFSEEHLRMVKNPAHGYGKNMNPCIDCHGMMLKRAGEFLRNPLNPPFEGGQICPPSKGELGEVFDFIATGEVLGQRPMSQNKEALKTVEKISELEGKLLRPLSAKLLAETEAEKDGKVTRGGLSAIKGRKRDEQMALAGKFGIKEYPSPAGGCLLTDSEFSQRLIRLFDNWSECDGNDIELLKNGRVFWLRTQANAEQPPLSPLHKGCSDKVMIVMGRNEKECENLEKLAQKNDILLELKEETGPLTLIRSKNQELRIMKEMELEIPKNLKLSELKLGEEKSEEEILEIAELLTGYYASKARGKKMTIELRIAN